jgi:uncharacterized membrane protein
MSKQTITNSGHEWIMWLAMGLSYAVTVYVWPQAPETVPIHWNFEGVADGFASKTLGLSLMPIVITVLYFFLRYLPLIDPKKENFEQFGRQYSSIRIAVHLFLLIIHAGTTLSIVQQGPDFPVYMLLAVLGLFIVIGNAMINIKQNYFVGIRTPWTLANNEVWVRTHRFGGYLWTAGGVVLLGISLLLLIAGVQQSLIMQIFIISMVLISLIPVLYSYLLYKKIQQKE